MPYYYHATLNNGVTLSIQANVFNKCEPKRDNVVAYTKVEIGFPSEEIDLLTPYKENPNASASKTVFPYVPVEIVQKIIKSAGGLKTLSPIPPGILTREEYADIYKRCSEAIPQVYKADWLEEKASLMINNPHEWCVAIYNFMDKARVELALDKWALFREEHMDGWRVDNIPKGVDTYTHYKSCIQGWDEDLPLERRLDLISKQLWDDINLQDSYDEWLAEK